MGVVSLVVSGRSRLPISPVFKGMALQQLRRKSLAVRFVFSCLAVGAELARLSAALWRLSGRCQVGGCRWGLGCLLLRWLAVGSRRTLHLRQHLHSTLLLRRMSAGVSGERVRAAALRFSQGT